MEIGLTIVGVLVLAALAYVAYVNRRVQTYAGHFFVAAPPDEVADALVPVAGDSYLSDNIRVEAVDAGGNDLRFAMPNGVEGRVRILADDRPREIVFEGVTRRRADAPWGDRMFSRERVTPAPGGSRVDLDIRVERADLRTGWLLRLGYPFQARIYRLLVETEIARRRNRRQKGPWG